MELLFGNLIYLAQTDTGDGAGAASVVISLLCALVLAVFFIAVYWIIFTKAGKPGWAAIIPIYNFIVLLEIVGRPVWWIILFFIPVVNIVIGLLVAFDLAKAFGKGEVFGCGLFILPIIFYPLLAFGDARYQGPPN